MNKKYESAPEHRFVLLQKSLIDSNETRVIAEYYRFEFNSQSPYAFEHSVSSWLMSFKRALAQKLVITLQKLTTADSLSPHAAIAAEDRDNLGLMRK
jgi:hypothetical protein